MKIVIDVRESELINMCKHYLGIMPTCKDIEIEVKSLPIGDIILTLNDVEKVVIERKSLTDLASSIKDGRYEEQSYRLNGSNHHNHNIIYLIEGDLNKQNTMNSFKSKIDKTTLYSAMVSILCYKGFSLMRSSNLEETAIMICNMAYKIRKSEADGKSFYYKCCTEPDVPSEEIKQLPGAEEKGYCSVVKKVKKDNITKDNIGEIMLCQIPGVSSVSAIAIMDKFKTFPNLLEQLKENKECLKDIQYTNTAGQTRKISKAISENILRLLFSE